MYNGKPVIAAKRPFWRHPIFPWGWYSLSHDACLLSYHWIKTDGHDRPYDRGGMSYNRIDGYWFSIDYKY